ncbi:hypothetical protein E4U21_006365 [Claviceps maximensis]|nr:hypothetical protein E4U21_006365 [Claviceps maximensis]
MSTPPPPPITAEERFPRVTIQFCTQCRWMLRAAYYAQELLSTFSNSLGQVSLQPSTGGVFTITIQASSPTSGPAPTSVPPEVHMLWDRKRDGGFPEVKELKRRVRDVVEPGRNLGHVDGKGVGGVGQTGGQTGEKTEKDAEDEVKNTCEDCAAG